MLAGSRGTLKDLASCRTTMYIPGRMRCESVIFLLSVVPCPILLFSTYGLKVFNGRDVCTCKVHHGSLHCASSADPEECMTHWPFAW